MNGPSLAADRRMRHTLDYDPLDALLRAGLVHLESGELDDARRSFEEVLRRKPGHVEALAGLRAVEQRGLSQLITGRPSGPSGMREIAELMRDERYEEALAALYRERESRPDDPAIARSIRIVESHLERREAADPAEPRQPPGPKRRV